MSRYSSKRIAATDTVALSGAPYKIERLNDVTSINVNCTSWLDFDVNGKLFIFKMSTPLASCYLFKTSTLWKFGTHIGNLVI